MRRANSLERPWCWERLRVGGEGDDRGWDGWMASSTWWTLVRVDSRSWWWTGKPGVLQFMGSQRVGHDWVTDLNWWYRMLNIFYMLTCYLHIFSWSCLFIFCPFLNWVFFYYWVLSVSCIFRDNTLLLNDACVAKIFSKSVPCILILLTVTFIEQKHVTLMKLNLSFFSFLRHDFCLYIRSHH